MKYMGSKARFAKEILPITLKNRADQWYVEPFAGGMNIIDKVTGNRLANDSNKHLIAMFEALVSGWEPEYYDREFYAEVRDLKIKYEPYIVGWLGFGCSYCGKFFGGYAGKVQTKTGIIRDYQSETLRNVQKQIPKLQGVVFTDNDYREMNIPDNSIIYCDPPYKNTTGYSNGFNHDVFWDWVREKSKDHAVFVSEYEAPKDFKCVWEKEAKSSLMANSVITSNKTSTERLFRL